MPFYRPIVTCWLAAGLCALTPTLGLARQDSTEAPAPAPAGQATPSVVDQALEHLDAGALDAAIAVLELAPEGDPRAASLLGALYLDAGRAEDAWKKLEPLATGVGQTQPAVLYNAGRAALATSRIEEAETFLARSVELESGTPAARELGMLRGALGDLAAAYPLLRPWAINNPEDAEARLAAAVGALELGRLSEAEELLSDIDQQDPEVRVVWARLLLGRRDAVGAYAMLEPLLASSEQATRQVKALAVDAQLAMAQPQEALALLEGRDPGDPLAALQATRALYQDGRIDEALAAIRPFADLALETDLQSVPRSRRSMVGRISLEMARILAAQGEYSKALPFLKKATQVVPEEAEGWRLLGRALAATERRDDADAALAEYQALAERVVANQQARERDPVSQVLDRAQELAASGLVDDGLELASREAQINPKDPRPRIVGGAILLAAGRSSEALASANSAIAIAGPSVDALYLRGAARLAESSLEAAETDLQAALALVPDYVPALNDLAVVMIRTQRLEPARELLLRVLELVPEHVVARENLEKING